MREYFDAEMRLLQEAAQEFAEAYPEQAGMLNLRELKDRDPYIERLLEGTAYLTAHIRKRIDDGVPNISENILKQICPSLLRPYPSIVVIQNTPTSSFHEQIEVKKGLNVSTIRYVDSEGGDKGSYNFRTCYPQKLVPLIVDDVSYCENDLEGMTFYVDLRWNVTGSKADFDLSELCFYIHADQALSVAIYHSLVGALSSVSVSFPCDDISPVALGAQNQVLPHNVGVLDGLLPNIGQSHPGFSLLQDYFLARERFLFFSVRGLEKIDWCSIGEHCNKFTLKFESRVNLPRGSKVRAGNLKLNCVPAINLFDMGCEPIKQTLKKMQYPLTPAIDKMHYVDVYSVNTVSAFNSSLGKRSYYYPLYELQDKEPNEKYYNEVYCDTGADKLVTYLQVSPDENALDDVICCEITATNAHLPREYIHLGDLNILGDKPAKLASSSNITRPTEFFLPPSQDYYQWQLVSLLTLKLSTIANVTRLKKLLKLFDWSKKRDNQKRIDGINKIEVEPRIKVMRGTYRQGIEITLTLAEDRYSSKGDIYLFGQVLHSFFSMYAMMNEFVQTKIICLPSYEEFLWMPKAGLSSPM